MSDKKRLTASERESMLRMNVVLEILSNEPGKLAARAAMIPGAKRDLAMIASRIHKIMDQFNGTIPEEQLKSYLRSLETATYVVGARRPGGTAQDLKDYGTWLPFEVLNTLIEGCHDHCMMCPGDKAQRRACKLKKALEIIPNDTPDRDDGDCPFYSYM